MALKLYDDTDIQDIADAIREKNGSTNTYLVSEMAQAITNIPSGSGTINYKKITLWSNSSPTSAFTTAEISLSNLSYYDLILVAFRYSTSNTSTGYIIFNNQDGIGTTKNLVGAIFRDASGFVYVRKCSINYTDNKIVFDTAARRVAGTGTNTSEAIPITIIGVKMSVQ